MSLLKYLQQVVMISKCSKNKIDKIDKFMKYVIFIYDFHIQYIVQVSAQQASVC